MKKLLSGVTIVFTVVFLTLNSRAQCPGTSLTFTSHPSIASQLPSPNNFYVCAGQPATLSVYGAVTYTWSDGSHNHDTIVNANANANYTLSASDAAGCIITEVITVIPLSGGLNVSYLSYVCSGNPITLQILPGLFNFNVLWSNGSTQQSIVVTQTATTTYSVTNTDCNYIQIFSITNVPGPTLTIAPLQQTVCAGSPCTLTASGGDTYMWNTNAHTNSVVVMPLQTTTYSVVGVGGPTGGCSGTVTASVTAIPGPTLTVSSSQDTICSGKSATLTVAGAISYTWSTGLTAASIVVTPTTALTSYTVSGTGGPTGNCMRAVTISQVTDPCTGLKEDTRLHNQTTVFPNPFNGAITILYSAGINGIELTDITGRLLIKENVNALSELHVNTAHLLTGVYFLSVNRGKPVKIIRN